MSSESYPTQAELLAESLEVYTDEKWGWVIYRCTYGDDDAWARFQDLAAQALRRDLRDADLPPIIADRADWIFVSDAATLDGASRDALRERFVSWVAEETSRHTLGGDKSSRHTYFVQVDEASLRSVVDADAGGSWDNGWINLVRCQDGMDYNQNAEMKKSQEEYARQLVEDGEEDAEEHATEGWMMLTTSSMGVSTYACLGGRTEDWYCFYSVPPNLVIY